MDHEIGLSIHPSHSTIFKENIMTSTTIYSVYKLASTMSPKIYIGYSKNIKQRMAIHIQRHSNTQYNSALYAAMRKYGAETFSMEVLVCTRTELDCQCLERILISDFNCLVPNGYNIDAGGKGGNKMADENVVVRNKESGEVEVINKTGMSTSYVGLNFGNRKISVDNKEYRVKSDSDIFSAYSHLMSLINSYDIQPIASKKRHGLYKDADGNNICLPKDSVKVKDGTVVGTTSGFIKVRYFHTGELAFLEKNHPDVVSRKCVCYNGGNQIPVTDGISLYGSVTDAANVIGRDPDFIRRRIRLSLDGWGYAPRAFGD